MLKSVTKRFHDQSTDTAFRFVFYCDLCGKAWESDAYPFDDPFAGNAEGGEKRARDILWRTEHDAAYERANLEARLHFNRCERCGKNVCDDCYELCVCSDGRDVCAACSEKRCACPGRVKEPENGRETEQCKKE